MTPNSFHEAPIRIDSWPRAILHVDADGFFATVEQAIHPELKGRPVITGAERGIVAAASYEAKAFGIKRGVPLSEVKKICPQCVMLPSDYETYSLFSKRIFAILRDFTPDIEEYSIDEAFADLTGLRRLNHASYPVIAQRIKERMERDLGITVSVGLSLSKSLAKLCSKFRKPSGFTAVPGRLIHELLKRTTLEKVWGFGPNTVAYLTKMGMKTALDFVKAPQELAKKRLGKIGFEIWGELRGESVYPLNPAPKTTYQSICKSKTFSPPSSDPAYVLAQVLRNTESACIKARRYHLGAMRLIVYLKHQDFSHTGTEAILSRQTCATLELVEVARGLFRSLFKKGALYRATGVVLADLSGAQGIQFGLFEDPVRVIKMEQVSATIDAINGHYGKHAIHVGDSLLLKSGARGMRDKTTSLQQNVVKGETRRQHIALPRLAIKV